MSRPYPPQANPAYLQWHRIDQMLLSALLSSLTEPILAQAIASRTSRELWVTLDAMFTSQSQAKTSKFVINSQT